MKERHFAYKITHTSSGLECIHSEIEADKMVDLLQDIQQQHSAGLFWIFKQFGDNPKEQLCIVDCATHRIYYHHSGEVEDIQDTIKRLNH